MSAGEGVDVMTRHVGGEYEYNSGGHKGRCMGSAGHELEPIELLRGRLDWLGRQDTGGAGRPVPG